MDGSILINNIEMYNKKEIEHVTMCGCYYIDIQLPDYLSKIVQYCSTLGTAMTICCIILKELQHWETRENLAV